ncbi:dTDP-4-dehydrorhamnose reductase family protein [Acinetobacter guillouiae]|uniref:dTDP-4-dehydrorhamnose reductase family protein n=1 Tax=Acinetobacter guillouiae TaxID=106649 RepID=UPI001AE3E15F|nr:SDR family oxidoreductase [Acinetobacter guillouiae]MBP2546896.1 dTDP-4-dehydrorhamnose reductase [Acinetobacter guillouiae]
MKKILILGASGMAGHVIFTYLKEHTHDQIFGTTNQTQFDDSTIKLDIFDKQKVEALINDIRPDILINCVGILIKESRLNPDTTIYCNSFFPHFLKKCVQKINGKLIHISTDCVFSGKDGGYTEHSFKDAVDVYGLSKSLGEIEDQENLTIRTSIIGPEIKKNGEGLFHWFMLQNKEINGFKSNYWSGVTTLELAKFIQWVVQNPITGLINLTNGRPISKYDLLSNIKHIYGKTININSDKDYVCDKTLKSERDIQYKVCSYEKMLVEQKDFMEEHKNFYDYY